MFREHQKSQEELKNEINRKRVIAEKAVERLTTENVQALNDDISQAYLNQHKLDSEARKLQANVIKLGKQAQQWMAICNNLNGAVKDLGDIKTWTSKIEDDIKFISKTIEESVQPTDVEQ